MIGVFPIEIWRQIILMIDNPHSLYQLMRVSTEIRVLAFENEAWKKFLLPQYAAYPPRTNDPEKTHFLDFKSFPHWRSSFRYFQDDWLIIKISNRGNSRDVSCYRSNSYPLQQLLSFESLELEDLEAYQPFIQAIQAFPLALPMYMEYSVSGLRIEHLNFPWLTRDHYSTLKKLVESLQYHPVRAAKMVASICGTPERLKILELGHSVAEALKIPSRSIQYLLRFREHGLSYEDALSLHDDTLYIEATADYTPALQELVCKQHLSMDFALRFIFRQPKEKLQLIANGFNMYDLFELNHYQMIALTKVQNLTINMLRQINRKFTINHLNALLALSKYVTLSVCIRLINVSNKRTLKKYSQGFSGYDKNAQIDFGRILTKKSGFFTKTFPLGISIEQLEKLLQQPLAILKIKQIAHTSIQIYFSSQQSAAWFELKLRSQLSHYSPSFKMYRTFFKNEQCHFMQEIFYQEKKPYWVVELKDAAYRNLKELITQQQELQFIKALPS